MHKIYELKEKLIDEMEEYAGKQNLSKDDVMTLKYLSSAVDHMCNILEKCEEESEGSYGYDYNRGSYARGGRGSYAMMPHYSRAQRRDSMGRYSRAEDDFKMELQELINEAPNDQVRQKMQDIMYGM